MIRLALCVAIARMLTPEMGVAQDYEAVVRKLRPLAEQGDASAQSRLGNMYDTGRGVPKDYAEAVKWYRKAAKQGEVEAQVQLGIAHFLGQGALQDFVTAHMWLNLAEANGAIGGAEWRDQVASRMSPADVSEAQRRARVCQASDYLDCD